MPRFSLTPVQRRVLGQADGVILDQRSASHRIVLLKVGSQVRLHFADPSSDELIIPANIMSRIDLLRPLTLLATYTQAMLLSLVWRDRPARIFSLGFGGGRMPLILYSHFPSVVIDNTETEGDLKPIVEAYFGLTFDERQRLHIGGGREFLESLADDVRYDIMLLDGFVGTGWLSGYDLATVEFYALCRRHLVPGGVVSVNLLDSDPLFEEKIATFRQAFAQTFQFNSYEATVFFGTDSTELTEDDIERRALDLQRKHGFAFPFAANARYVRAMEPPSSASADLLTDAAPPEQLRRALSPDDPLFFGAQSDAPCPCGSRRTFSACHREASAAPGA